MRRCSTCKKNKKEITDNFYKKKKGGWEPSCIPCLKKKSKKYYHSNSKRAKKSSTISRKKRQFISKSYVFNYLKIHPCIDCGESNILTLEFDHINPKNKKYNISWLVTQGCPIPLIKKEIKKCEVRCANCHKIKTSKQQGWYRYLMLEEETDL